jgi:GGDEF domain-containing protein
MKRIRVRIIVLASWLVFFSILSGQLNLALINNTTKALVFLTVIAGLFITRLPRVQIWVMVMVPIAALLLTKFWSGDFSGDLPILRAAIEVSTIAVSTFLSFWVSTAISEFENAVADITLGQRDTKIESALAGQGSIYREVRRARNHKQPLALLSIGIDEKSIEPSVERIVQEIQRSMMKRYKLRVLSKMLCDQLEDCAVIVQETDRYLAVLPETTPEDLLFVVERLRQKSCSEVGVEIKIGIATLPHDSYTFDGLVEKATQDMLNDREPQPCSVMESFPIEQRINR